MANTYRILSLDGGGIRGVLTAVWLSELEKMLDKSLREYFNLIAGTSTGSILVCAVAMGIPAREILTLYIDQGKEVFPSTGERMWSRFTRTFTQGVSAPKYDGTGLERVLQTCLGNQKFGSLPVRTMVITYDTQNRQSAVLKSTKPEHKDLPVWQVCKASSSAPTYFPAQIVEIGGAPLPLIDGGVVANNPTACAIAEAVKVNRGTPGEGLTIEKFVVASFGTGEAIRPITAKQAEEWGALEWAIPIIGVLFDGSADATDYVARQLIDENNYFRFQTSLQKGFDDMDDASATNIDALRGTAVDYLQNRGGRAKLERLADKLCDTSV